VKIFSHQKDILFPVIEAIYSRGRLLGHESDDGITTEYHSWLVCDENDTEIIFFEKE
jgi:hypothetical protein